jgi:TP901 family phage tail tape measure protein
MAVNIRILADFDARGFKQAEAALADLGRTAGRVFAGLAVGAGVAAVGAIREFANFDAALTKSTAIMGNLSDAMRGEMSDAAREVAKVTTFSAEQAAESFFFLASAGLDAESSIAALPQVAAFAQAGMFDMARATDLLTDAQSALGLTIRDDAVANMENMIRVSDVLVKANTLANASVEQFSTALTTKAGASLRALNKDLEEGVAVLAAFADQGIKGELAGTQLAIVLRDLTTRGIKNKEAFEQFGIAVFDSNGKMNNLADIVGDLEGALAGMSDETQKATLLQLGFSDKSLASLQALLGTSDAIRTYEAELRRAGGTTDEVAGKQLDTLNAQLQLLKSEFLDVAISVGEQMTPAVRDLVERVKELLPELGERLVAALQKIDFAKIAEDVANFTIKIIENIDTIIEVGKQIVIATGVIFAFSTAVKVATTAQTIFNAVAAKNPYVIIALAAVTAGIAIANMVAQTNESRAALERQAQATGRSVEGQKQYNTELETYLRMQDNVRRGINNGTMATQQFTQSTSGLIAELNRAETVRFNNLVSEFKRVENAAVQARYQTSLLNEDLMKIARFGPGGGAGGGGAPVIDVSTFIGGVGSGAQEARDFVAEFFDGLYEEIAKQAAKLQLQELGLSEGLINQILGSGDWEAVFNTVIAGGQEMADQLQYAFERTGAGIAEVAAGVEETAEVALSGVSKVFAELDKEIAKQEAKGKLEGMGLSQGLINQILGSADWETVFADIIAGGTEMADALQAAFNKTAAGIAEVNKAADDAAQALADATERRNKQIEEISQQQFKAQTERFEKFRKLLEDFTAGMTSAFDSFSDVLFPESQFGRFETAVINLERSLLSLIETQSELFSEENRRRLDTFVSDTSEMMRAIAFARDEIASELEREQKILEQQVAGRRSMFESVFDRIIGAANVSQFAGTASGIIRQLRRTVEQAVNFENQLNQLRGLGLTDRAIKQIEQAGVASGSATARALLRGGSQAVQEVNSLYEQLADVAESQAAAQAGSLFDAGISVSEGLVNGLLSQQDQMRFAAEVLAAVFEEQFRAGISSAAIQFTQPDLAAIQASTREFYDWLDSLPALAGGQSRTIRGRVVVSGPGTGERFVPTLPSGASQQVGGGSTININITAGLGADGQQIGAAIVDAIARYESRNGLVFARA